MRELARQEALLCDLDRPAQSQLRLNPFWLPRERETWPSILDSWRLWLRELGVTAGGLGPEAYRHTLTAVTLTAKAALERGLTFDPSGLRQALEAPEFLSSLDHNGAASLFSEVSTWPDRPGVCRRFDTWGSSWFHWRHIECVEPMYRKPGKVFGSGHAPPFPCEKL